MMTRVQKITLIVVIFSVLILLAISVILFRSQQRFALLNEDQDTSAEKRDTVVAEDTKELFNDLKELSENKKLDTDDLDNFVEISVPDMENNTSTKRYGAVVAQGTSIIDLETGQVLADEGKVADNTAEPGHFSAPGQSVAIEDVEILPESTIKLNITYWEISPKRIVVGAGQVVSLAVTNNTAKSLAFRFAEDELKAIAIGLASQETRTITFNAPGEKGEYFYYVDNHGQTMADGLLIVQ